MELTAETAASYTIYDVVLPLPGVDVQYPASMKDDYAAAMTEYNVTQENLKTRRKCVIF